MSMPLQALGFDSPQAGSRRATVKEEWRIYPTRWRHAEEWAVKSRLGSLQGLETDQVVAGSMRVLTTDALLPDLCPILA
jgi:hypothetical protein